MTIPEVINDMRCYIDGNDDCQSATSVEQPDLSSMTTDVKGIGVAGIISAPIHGHYESLEVKVNWQVPTKTATRYHGGKPIRLEAYSDVQGFDSGAEEYTHDRYRMVVRGRVKSYSPGSLEAGNTSGSSTTIEAHYYKLEYGGETLVEIDKYGYKAIIGGKDLLAEVRKNIGMN